MHDKGHPDTHEVFREFRQLLDSYSAEQPRFAVGEIHIFDWQKWASYYGEKLDELHMPFNFSLLNVAWDAQEIRKVVETLEAAIPPGAWPNYVLGNHDYWRIATRYGKAQARVAAMLLLTLRGTPTIYYGEEIGMTDVPVPPEREQDPWGLNQPGFSRDPCRTPMQWSAGPNAGFSAPETGELWLPLASDYQEVNVERQLENAASMLSLYRRLLAYRRTTPALLWGDYQPVDDTPEACYVFLRQAGDERVLVALNFSGEEQQVSLPGLGAGSVAVSTRLDRTEAIEGESLVLRGDEGVIIELSGQ